jgi:glycerate kinase
MKFYDQRNRLIEPFGNSACAAVARVDPTGFVNRCTGIEFAMVCDVDNPLIGPLGASAVFGPQKCSPSVRSDLKKLSEVIEKLEHNLNNLARAFNHSGGKPVETVKGLGAGGGFPLGFSAFLNPKLERGGDIVLRTLNFENYRNFDAFFTCEGFCDGQTLHGKAPHAVCSWLKGSFGVVLCGGIESPDVENQMRETGASIVLPICEGPITLEEAIGKTPQLLARAAARVFYGFLWNKYHHKFKSPL